MVTERFHAFQTNRSLPGHHGHRLHHQSSAAALHRAARRQSPDRRPGNRRRLPPFPTHGRPSHPHHRSAAFSCRRRTSLRQHGRLGATRRSNSQRLHRTPHSLHPARLVLHRHAASNQSIPRPQSWHLLGHPHSQNDRDHGGH